MGSGAKPRTVGNGAAAVPAVAVAVAAAALVAGCAPAPRVLRGADIIDSSGIPSGPGAREYVTPGPRADRDGDSLRREIAGAVARAAAALGRPAPARDTRLDRVADDLARAVRGGELASFDVVAFLLSHHGIVEPEPSLVLSAGAAGAEAALVDHLAPQIPHVMGQGHWGRLGIGVARSAGGDGGELRVVLAFQEQHLTLHPVPRRLPAAGTARIAGRLSGGYRSPQVLVTVPAGAVRELRVRHGRSGFEATVSCNEGKGPYQVEIGGENERGPTVLANFPIYCGVEPPRRPPDTAAGTREDQDPEEAERDLLALANSARAAARLAPLRWDVGLAKVARAYSREMADSGLVGHISPSSGSPVDRVRRAGMNPALLLENIAREYSAASAHRGLMASPGHRANILEARATHVGVGVAAGRAEGGARPLFVTQLFAAGI